MVDVVGGGMNLDAHEPLVVTVGGGDVDVDLIDVVDVVGGGMNPGAPEPLIVVVVT